MAVFIKLKELREERGISQNQLARVTGMSPQNIQKIEQGRSKGIQFDTLEKFCQALNCEIEELLVRINNGA
ncbi:MAG: helix-turn-helix domain-containing protein [Acaryochloris sp. RU_4_1]|nr:helix-turn-helix domain-containing protein [Acaryochloris sp. RU_4_1]NJR56949.1 helix-turn-helix domain-containing protein [Acaryochloris sp. CRU_2_0]